jgi:hypothetical protein
VSTLGGGAIKSGVGRREALVTAAGIFILALLVRIWAASQINYPRPEDTAYYFGVARNLVEGRGLVSDALWSYATPPLTFPRPAFEVWLPLPTFLSAIPMFLFGPTFGSSQWAPTLVGALVPVLAWRLAADLAEDLAMPTGRARSFAIGTGLTSAVYMPLVLHSALPDSTIPFAALSLGACLLMRRIVVNPGESASVLDRRVVALGLLLGLAALTRNEAIWLALTWAVVAIAASRGWGDWAKLVGVAAVVSFLVFLPWALRDWMVFGSPLPGQALLNAVSVNGRDIFAYLERPTLQRYLGLGIGTLISLRVEGFLHNLLNVLVFLGIPVSLIGLGGLFWTARIRALWPLVLFSFVTFWATTLIFPVATTWGTFLHAAGAVPVLIIMSALLSLDGAVQMATKLRGWTRPVSWLAPAFTVASSFLFLFVLLPGFGRDGHLTAARYSALKAVLAAAGETLGPDHAPVISDFPIWLAEDAHVRTLGLPDEPPANVLELSHLGGFDANLLIVQADNGGQWPEVAESDLPGAECFRPLELGTVLDPTASGLLQTVRVYQIACP